MKTTLDLPIDLVREIKLRAVDEGKKLKDVVAEPPGIESQWKICACLPSASPKVWMDAYLAAFAITAGLEFACLDKDFRSYERHGLTLRLLIQ